MTTLYNCPKCGCAMEPPTVDIMTKVPVAAELRKLADLLELEGGSTLRTASLRASASIYEDFVKEINYDK